VRFRFHQAQWETRPETSREGFHISLEGLAIPEPGDVGLDDGFFYQDWYLSPYRPKEANEETYAFGLFALDHADGRVEPARELWSCTEGPTRDAYLARGRLLMAAVRGMQ
jgi:hypothetical protein